MNAPLSHKDVYVSPSSSTLRDLIATKLATPPASEPGQESVLTELASQLLGDRADCVRAVVLYGSRLSATTSSPSSLLDFYLIVDDVDAYHSRRVDRWTNQVLPPNVYFRPAGGKLSLGAKVCVLSAEQLRHETSLAARDVYHLGRFSKRYAVLWARDADRFADCVDATVHALQTLTLWALLRSPASFTLDDFARSVLRLSYEGETRLVEPTKVDNLFRSEQAYYRAVFELLLRDYLFTAGSSGPAALGPGTAHSTPGASGARLPSEAVGDAMRSARGWLDTAWTTVFARRPDAPAAPVVELTADGSYRRGPIAPEAARRVEAFLRLSRLRGQLRWPKYLVTFDNWLDYLVAKVERHTGRPVELTERQRRWPLIFAWPRFLELRRSGWIR